MTAANPPLLMLASDHAEKGRCYQETFAPGVVAATTPGDGTSFNPKVSPNEDSLAVVARAGGGVAALVADSHFGPAASEITAREFVAAMQAGMAGAAADLGTLLRGIDAQIPRQRPEVEVSETTALAVVVEDGHLAWASVGDSVLFYLRSGQPGLQRLTRAGAAFLGGGWLRRAFDQALVAEDLVLETGTARVSPGDLLLLVSDGIEPGASGMSSQRLEQVLAAPDSLDQRVAALLAEAGRASNGGGRDNLTVVAIECRRG